MLMDLVNSPEIDPVSRKELARKLIENEELKLLNILKKPI